MVQAVETFDKINKEKLSLDRQKPPAGPESVLCAVTKDNKDKHKKEGHNQTEKKHRGYRLICTYK